MFCIVTTKGKQKSVILKKPYKKDMKAAFAKISTLILSFNN